MVGEKWHRVRQIELAIWTPKQREGGVKPREVSTRYFESVRPLVPNSNTRLLGGCFCLCHMVGEKWHRVRQIELAIWTPKQREGGVKPREVSTRYFELVRPF